MKINHYDTNNTIFLLWNDNNTNLLFMSKNYTTSEVANELGVGKGVVYYRCDRLGIEVIESKNGEHLFTERDFYLIQDFYKPKKEYPDKFEIIYVNRTSEIYNSISNIWGTHKINKIMKEYEQ